MEGQPAQSAACGQRTSDTRVRRWSRAKVAGALLARAVRAIGEPIALDALAAVLAVGAELA